jgi:hypothetical protein
MIATRHRLPHTTTRRRNCVTVPSNHLLIEQYNSSPTHQPDKPPFEGVPSAWRLDHATALNNTQGRALALPSKRVARWRMTKRLSHMAQLAEMPHNQNRIHDGQEWSSLGHSLPTSQLGQE